MGIYEIPTSASPQSFQIALAGVTYKLTLMWRDAPGGGWFLDIADSAGSRILSGIPLVTGADLLEQYDYLAFGGELWVQTDSDAAAVPTFDNIGTASHLYFVVP